MMIIAVAAAALGLIIAIVDVQPTWDDTGITAGALLLAGLAVGFIARRSAPGLGILVGAWVPLLTIARGGDPAATVGLALAIGGAFAGAFVGRAVAGSRAGR